MMNILITGGTGLVGTALVKKLEERNHTVRILTRSESEEKNEFYWNIDDKKIDDKAFENLDCIIHLAGANISERWTDDYKKELYSSRIDSANLLREYCEKKEIHLQSFISSSGVNYYGTFTSDQILTEESQIVENDFLAELCVAWENAADQFSSIAEQLRQSCPEKRFAQPHLSPECLAFLGLVFPTFYRLFYYGFGVVDIAPTLYDCATFFQVFVVVKVMF